MYERIPGDEAAKRAHRQLNYITAFFPQTVYGKVGRAKLAGGIPTPDPSAAPATELDRLALIDGKVRPTVPPAAAGPAPAFDSHAAPNAIPVLSPAPTTTSTFPAPTNGPTLTEPATPTAPTLRLRLRRPNSPAPDRDAAVRGSQRNPGRRPQGNPGSRPHRDHARRDAVVTATPTLSSGFGAFHVAHPRERELFAHGTLNVANQPVKVFPHPVDIDVVVAVPVAIA